MWQIFICHIFNCLIQNNHIYVGFGPCSGQYFNYYASNFNHFTNNVISNGQTFQIGSNTGTDIGL